jgi:hypothetical protein
MSWRKTYTGYSIGCAVVWAVILSVVAVVYPNRLHTFLLIGAGWWIGWTSATIARSVYPPPKTEAPRDLGPWAILHGVAPYPRAVAGRRSPG